MSFHTFSQNILVKSVLTARTLTGNANGSGIFCEGYERALLVLEAGTLGGTSPTLSVQLQESADDGSTDAYAGHAPTAGVIAPTAAGIYLMDIDLRLRLAYIRFVFTVGGTSPSIPVGAVLLLDRARSLPPSQDGVVVSL